MAEVYIDSLTLENFGPFYGEHILNFGSVDGRCGILVGGKNGAGKTHLLRALYLAVVGESGIGVHVTRRGPDWQTIRHEANQALLREFHLALAPQPFAGLLHWHYGSPDSTEQDDYPALTLFPQYGEVLKAFRFTH